MAGCAGATAVVEAEAFPFSLAFLDGIAVVADVDGVAALEATLSLIETFRLTDVELELTSGPEPPLAIKPTDVIGVCPCLCCVCDDELEFVFESKVP